MEKINKTSSVDGGKDSIDEERQARLREQARRLIAETRTKSLNLDSPSSPIKNITHRITLSPERTISPINTMDGFVFNKNNKEDSPIRITDRITPPKDGFNTSPTKKILDQIDSNRNSPVRKNRENSPLQSFNSLMDKISPKGENKVFSIHILCCQILMTII